MGAGRRRRGLATPRPRLSRAHRTLARTQAALHRQEPGHLVSGRRGARDDAGGARDHRATRSGRNLPRLLPPVLQRKQRLRLQHGRVGRLLHRLPAPHAFLARKISGSRDGPAIRIAGRRTRTQRAPHAGFLRPALRSRMHRFPQDRANRAEPPERGAGAATDPPRYRAQRALWRQAGSTAAAAARRGSDRAMSARTRLALRITRWGLASVLLAVMAACAPLPPRNPIATWVPSKNFDVRKPQLIVLHFTNEDSAQQALDTLRTANSGGPVSAHYLVGRDGHIYQLVSDVDRAWHAGGGRWGTITDVNSASIGIEIDNNGRVPFPPAQIDSLMRLL